MNTLENDNYYEEYNNVFLEWLSEGLIEEVLAEEIDAKADYLPHRDVLKPQLDSGCFIKFSSIEDRCYFRYKKSFPANQFE